MRLKLISCEIFYREMCAVVARSPNCVDIEFLPYGLHTVGTGKMQERLQQAIDQVEPDKYEAILMGYGLCNNGICGLQAGQAPLVDSLLTKRIGFTPTSTFGRSKRWSRVGASRPLRHRLFYRAY